jgi:ATP-dependent helicase/nuclease subunit B
MPKALLPEELVRFVERSKRHDPLAPVTVLCPSGYAAVFVRRALATSYRAGGSSGVANLSTTTVDGLVRAIGAPALAARGLRPVSAQIAREALRVEALERGGWPGRFADHPRALTSLERAVTELGRCPASALDSIAARSERASVLVELVGGMRLRLHSLGFADELDVVQAALRDAHLREKASPGPHEDELGQVIAWDLPRLPRMHAALLVQLGARPVVGACAGGRSASRSPGISALVECPDAEEEARAATRLVVRAAENGTPLWRQAVWHPSSATYGRLLHLHLDDAGVASNGPVTLRLERYAASRVLLGFLALASGDWARDEVVAWLTSAPLVAEPCGRPVPGTAWDLLSARAGVVKGAQQWSDRLAHHCKEHPSDEAEATALSRFVAELAERSCPPGRSWSAHSHWAVGVLDRYLGTTREAPVPPWPADQAAAASQIRGVVESLADLDSLSASTDVRTFRLALEAQLARTELEGEAGKGGFGDGVFVAPLDMARGLSFESVVVCGLADSLVPGSPARDQLLSEEARSADTSGTLRTPTRTEEEVHDELLCALGGGEHRYVTLPRRDPRTGRAHVPSRWLAEVTTPETERNPVASFAATLSAGGPTLCERELRLRALNGWAGIGGTGNGCPVTRADGRLEAGFDVVTSRSSGAFTRFDGFVGVGKVSPFDPGTPVSATRFETYAHCPRRYLLERCLGIGGRVLPEDLWRMEPTERGRLVHAILESYVSERLAGAPRSQERLLAIAGERFDEAEAGGLVGKRLLWRIDRASIERELRRFHEEEGDLMPIAAEHTFGGDDTEAAPAVVVVLEDGREVHFRGSADRVDRTAAGRLVVSDYKTGRQSALEELLRDPVAAGTLLQLPLYGLAARERFGTTSAVHARYWLLSTERSASFYNLVVTESVEERFREVVGRIAAGVEGGCFPGVPGAARFDGHFDNCAYCDFDRVCPPDRDRQCSRKLGDPTLADVRALMREDDGTWRGTVVKGYVHPDELHAPHVVDPEVVGPDALEPDVVDPVLVDLDEDCEAIK